MATKLGTTTKDKLLDDTADGIDVGTYDFGFGGDWLASLPNITTVGPGGQLVGTPGNDHFYAGPGNDYFDGGDGRDTVSYAFSAHVALVDLQAGFALSDGIDTLISIENVTGSGWNDTILGSAAINILHGGGGEDKLDGRGGDDYLNGGESNDTLIGGFGHDLLVGGTGYDRIEGGSGNDRIWGGLHDDIMTGGSGADLFYYQALNETWGLDLITDFQHGIDKIDLSAIDARPDIGGNQSFFFDSTQDGDVEEFFDGFSDDWSGLISGEPGPWINGDTGEIEIRHSGGYTYVYISTGDGLTDASIRLQGTINLTASDFIL